MFLFIYVNLYITGWVYTNRFFFSLRKRGEPLISPKWNAYHCDENIQRRKGTNWLIDLKTSTWPHDKWDHKRPKSRKNIKNTDSAFHKTSPRGEGRDGIQSTPLFTRHRSHTNTKKAYTQTQIIQKTIKINRSPGTVKRGALTAQQQWDNVEKELSHKIYIQTQTHFKTRNKGGAHPPAVPNPAPCTNNTYPTRSRVIFDLNRAQYCRRSSP